LAKLFPALGKAGLDELIKRFLTVDESSIEARHRFFYAVIAPMVRLYEVAVGDTLTIRGYTKSGYLKAVNVKVYGAFRFKGLERSDIAGGHNLLDMLTFRDLYGYMTEERRKEADKIRSQVGVREVVRASAEDALFGEGSEVVERREAEKRFDEFAEVKLGGIAQKKDATTSTFSQTTIDRGVALNAAVILEDAEQLEATRDEIKRTSEARGLGIQVVDWQTAAGIVGQFIILIRIVLYIAIAIIFTVALVIINNSMITATMERVTEIGTMRAIGAQRSVVMLTKGETFLER
jgi:ABC-type antimicrobial peptide transport system permease subunit